jgi:hypothetical protein
VEARGRGNGLAAQAWAFGVVYVPVRPVAREARKAPTGSARTMGQYPLNRRYWRKHTLDGFDLKSMRKNHFWTTRPLSFRHMTGEGLQKDQQVKLFGIRQLKFEQQIRLGTLAASVVVKGNDLRQGDE